MVKPKSTTQEAGIFVYGEVTIQGGSGCEHPGGRWDLYVYGVASCAPAVYIIPVGES